MVELFRGQRVLGVVPFASIDIPTVLDGALPENLHTQDADERPQELDAAFMFPEKTFYGTNAAADADPALFRLRLDNVPAGFTDVRTSLPFTSSRFRSRSLISSTTSAVTPPGGVLPLHMPSDAGTLR